MNVSPGKWFKGLMSWYSIISDTLNTNQIVSRPINLVGIYDNFYFKLQCTRFPFLDGDVSRFFCGSFMFFCLVFGMPLCSYVYLCLVVTCWERADLFLLYHFLWHAVPNNSSSVIMIHIYATFPKYLISG